MQLKLQRISDIILVNIFAPGDWSYNWSLYMIRFLQQKIVTTTHIPNIITVLVQKSPLGKPYVFYDILVPSTTRKIHCNLFWLESPLCKLWLFKSLRLSMWHRPVGINWFKDFKFKTEFWILRRWRDCENGAYQADLQVCRQHKPVWAQRSNTSFSRNGKQYLSAFIYEGEICTT